MKFLHWVSLLALHTQDTYSDEVSQLHNYRRKSALASQPPAPTSAAEPEHQPEHHSEQPEDHPEDQVALDSEENQLDHLSEHQPPDDQHERPPGSPSEHHSENQSEDPPEKQPLKPEHPPEEQQPEHILEEQPDPHLEKHRKRLSKSPHRDEVASQTSHNDATPSSLQSVENGIGDLHNRLGNALAERR